MEEKLCDVCHFQLQDNYYYCPNCGKKLKATPLSTSIGKQLSVYALSILLPPLGLWPGFRYLKQKEPQAKIIGTVAIVLTIISLTISIWLAVQIGQNINKEIDKQMLQYQNLMY